MIRIFLLLVSINSFAQSLEANKEVRLSFEPILSSIDQSGNLYLVTNRGLVVKYSSKGDSLLSFFPKKNGSITSIDARSGLRPFIFYKDFQEYAFLNQFITAASFHSFYPDLIDFAELVAVSSDNNLWVIDANDFSIKKYNPTNNTLELESPLNLVLDENDYDITQLKEYQNILFIHDRNNGLYLFDIYGSLQKKYDLDVEFINFYKDLIYYKKDDYLISLNIYSGSKTLIPIPIFSNPIQILRNANQVYFIEKTRIVVFNYNEEGKK